LTPVVRQYNNNNTITKVKNLIKWSFIS